MKNYLSLLLILFYLTTCNKKKDPEPPSVTKFENKAKITVNGVESNSTSYSSYRYRGSSDTLDDQIRFIYMFKEKKITLMFYIYGLKVRSYSSANYGEANIEYPDEWGLAAWDWEIDVTEVSNRGVKGTFYFHNTESNGTVTLTNGEFTCDYQKWQ